jgi:[acyl-carrier-protein] S-malonyltransferase
MAGLAIACPGQGAQHPGMFDLALQSPAATQWLAEYSDAADVDVIELARHGRDLFANRNAQLLMCGATVATWVALRERLAVPDSYLGYSVGEMSAYGCAGVWTVRQFADIVRRRAACMDNAAPSDGGLMAVKGLSANELHGICDRHRLAVAIVNADDHAILGGKRTDMMAAEEAIVARGLWCQILDVAVPAHTPVMQAAAAEFHTALAQSEMTLPTSPVLAGISGYATATRTEIADTLAAQIEQTVRWQDCMRSAVERGTSVVLELGPGKSLSRMFDELGESLESRSADDFRTLDGIAKWVDARLRAA